MFPSLDPRNSHHKRHTDSRNWSRVPFHHSILNDGGISNLVLGYAHSGMVAAAHWIAKLCTPALLKALNESPDSEVKIVGHSLGGAACMTWELAESGKHFMVPTLSASSVDDLRSEVAASSWLSDLWDQVEHTKVLKVVHHSATALGSHLKSISVAKDKVAGASAIVRPATSGTQHITSSVVNDIAEGKLWYELEKELEKQNYILNIRAQVEEAAVEKEITEEENQLIDAAQGSNSITPSHNVDSYRFYPPGKIMHIISAPSSDDSSSNSIEEHVKLYETPRQLYSKLRLSRTMINDHYMPTYRKMIQPLIQQLEKDINVK
ncbi:hypothetical protein GYH30_019456 [Glycine max]|uniref:Fungal lipase-type domain-containing protein n=2 Tax=Glycine subgen. Soja TaxID=1462606 RepID=A0A0R0J7P2_SOYBN|nr:hypothetical protein GYH30_019456 [Glycine max]RZC04472.1 hypothetical protein D0Y65_018872 [Glycine soja]